MMVNSPTAPVIDVPLDDGAMPDKGIMSDDVCCKNV